MARAARVLSERIREEDGVGTAVREIERALGRGGRAHV
jgi:hypothetical protein